ncbi:MAG: YceI family protein [Actinobacteria bacterium]|nr:YceI family protein [Actinomycetota bacterium]
MAQAPAATKIDDPIGTWVIDPAHSSAGFSATHMVFSKVRGGFNEIEGGFTVAEDSARSTAHAVLKAASITSNNEQRDGHLRSPDFLDADKYPEVTFESTKLELSSDSAAKLSGDLKIRDIVRPIQLDVTFNGFLPKDLFGSTRSAFTLTGKFNRKDYGLTWNQTLETGGVLVGDTVTLEIEVAAVRQDG